MSASVNSDDLDVNLTPLLDLVLQLIMFFMITVNFVRADQFDDSITLPNAINAVQLEKGADSYIFLNIDQNGKMIGTLSKLDLSTPGKLQYYLGEERKRLEQVAAAQRQQNHRVVVVIRAHKDCRVREIWDVVDACKRAGYEVWQLRVMKTAR